MKNFLFTLLVLALSPSLLSAQEYYRPKADPNLIITEIDDFKVGLPAGCSYSKEMSKPDEGNYVWSTPDKKFMFIYCYFVFGEDFSQEERLIGEAAQLGIELTGDDDIFNMKIDDSAYLSFSFTDKIAIGVTRFYPEDNVGICFFIFAPEADKDDNTLFNTITSIRAKD